MKLTKRAQSLFPSYASGPFPVTLQLIAACAAVLEAAARIAQSRNEQSKAAA